MKFSLALKRFVNVATIALTVSLCAPLRAQHVQAPEQKVSSSKATPRAESGDWLVEAPESVPKSNRGAPILLSITVTALSIAALVARWALKRRGLLQGVGHKPEELSILAQRSLGGAHQLVVIEACGERLLIGRSAEELVLLSHLPSAHEPASSEQTPLHQAEGLTRARATFADIDAQVAAKDVAPAPAVASGSPEVREPTQPQPPRDEPWPADLRGLHRWRKAPSAPVRSVGGP